MLGKVLKYDIKNCARYFIPLYLIFAAIVLITKLYLFASPESETVFHALSGLILSSYLFSLIGVFLLTEVFLVVYFYKKCFSREAYLTFTLPVKTGTHLLAKCLNCAVWHLLSFVLLFFSIFALFSLDDLQVTFRMIGLLFSSRIPIDFSYTVVFLILTGIVSLFSYSLIFYAPMAMGQVVTRHKILASVGIYIAFYIIFSLVSSFGSTFLLIGTEVISHGDATARLTVLSAFLFFLALAQAVLYYVLTYFFLSRKLNLT